MQRKQWLVFFALAAVLMSALGLVTRGQAVQAQGDDNKPGLIVFSSDRLGSYDVFTLDPETGLSTLLTNNSPAADIEPIFSPDGSSIAFVSDRDGDFELFVMRGDGSNLRQLTNNGAEERQPRWQPSGAFIVFASDMNGQWDLYAISADGAVVRQLTNDTFDERGPGAGGEGGVPGSPGVTAPQITPLPPTIAPAGSGGTGLLPDAVVKSNQLNVRANPGEGARVLTVVPRDTPLDIIGRYPGNEWVQVITPNGVNGWVYALLLEIGIDLNTVPVVNAPFTPGQPTATPTFTPVPVTAIPTAVPVVISFVADRTTITAGQCVAVSWYVEGIKAVFYQGEGVVGAGARQECPAVTTTYTLKVVLNDNTETIRQVTVTVN